MPKLKQLEVQGFKSFANQATFTFPTGITAIVGPNGSGKSNVSDAIRWVLGEQRMRSLRGRSGEDMIFAGSKRRARAGMARAALTFDNADGWLPVDFTEVTLERRTYRDGKSEYRLNGSKIRLRDLQDLLDHAGLGRDAYLIIGQGLVDHVLSLRPAERLALFEQAAGIAAYRSRREDAVKKLEATHHNLERVGDIIAEIEPRLRRLEKHVRRLEQHAQLTRELNKTLTTWYGYRWHQSLLKLERARQRAAYREDRALQKMEEADAHTKHITSLRRELATRRGKLAELHHLSSARHAAAERQQRELVITRERRRQVQERLEESRANLVPLRSALEAEEREVTTLEAQVAATAARLADARQRLTAAEAAYQALEQQRHALLRQRSEAQAQALEQRHRLADRQSRLEQSEAQLQQLIRRRTELERALASVDERRQKQQAAVEQARRQAEAAEQTWQEAQRRLTAVQAELESARATGEQMRQELGDKRVLLQQLTARLDMLERLHAEGAGLYAGVRAVLQAVERGQLRGLPGTLASLLEVPPRLEKAMEIALGGQLQSIVAETWRDAQAAIAWLKRSRAGRATFLPLDTLRPPRPLDLPQLSGVVGLAADLVQYEPRYRPAVRLTLGRTAIAQDLDAARALHRQLRGGFQIVTLEGEIMRSGGSVTGGERRQSRGSLLARERERRELPEQIAALEAELRQLQASYEQNETRRRDLEARRRLLAKQLQAAQAAHQKAEQTLAREEQRLEQLGQETSWQRHLLDESQAEQERLAETRARLERELQEAHEALAAAEAREAEADRSLAALADDEQLSQVAELRTQTALLSQEHDNQQVLLRTRRREAQRLRDQIAALEQRIGSLEARQRDLEASLAELQTRYAALQTEAGSLAAQIPPLEQTLTDLEQQLAESEAHETTLRQHVRRAEQELTQAEVELERRAEKVQSLRLEIEKTLGIVIGELPEVVEAQRPLPLQSIVAPLPNVAELPEGLEQQIRDLRTQLRRLGDLNPAAKQEHAEVQARYEFLREQAADLETASAHLRQIITELDAMMDTTFRATFKSIASEFKRIFQLLFNGGTAKLVLVEAEGAIRGVEITARPPGKRTSGLGMLSGGERTLTAVALIFAVMRVSPTPFCILDEVDAMLDEANVGRFRTMLQELSQHTQFIVITHNRGTVEAADTIYGVSMGEDGVSQVLSLDLADVMSESV